MVNRAGRSRVASRGESSGGGFKYRPRDAKSVQKRAEQSGGNFDSAWKSGVDTFRPKAGTNNIRILPATWEDHDHYGFDVFVHSYIGANSGTYVCLQKMKGEECPICEAQKEAKAGGEEEESKALAPKKVVAVWIIDRNDDPTPKLWAMSWSQDKEIASLCHDKSKGSVLLIDHPNKGYDVSFKRTGEGLKTKYSSWQIDRESSHISEDEDEQNEILDFIQDNPIPDQILYRDAAVLEKALMGKAPDKDRDLDDEEEPRRRSGSRDEDEEEKPRRRRDEDEEEEKPRRSRRDEEEEVEEKPRKRRGDDVEEEEKPRRSRRDEEEEEKPRRSRRDEPDEEEEKPRRSRRDEPDEEEEKPRRSRRDEEEEEKPRKRRDEEDEERPRKRRDEDEEEERPTRRERVR